MEKYVEKPKIIEFNGLPGCGKSTIAKAVTRELSLKGYKCYTCFFEKDIHKTHWFQIFHWCSIANLFKALILLFSQDKIKDTIPGFLALCRYDLMYESFSKYCSNNEILIIDQGVLQGLLSIAHRGELKKHNICSWLIEKIIGRTPNFSVVNCNVTPDIAYQRIEKRRYTSGRLDRASNSERLDALYMQSKNITVIRQLLPDIPTLRIINVDTKDSIDQNVLNIISTICL